MKQDVKSKKGIAVLGTGRILAVIAISAALLLIALILFLPSVVASSAMRRAERTLEQCSKVVLYDPYVENEVLPEAIDVTLSEEDGKRMVEELRAVIAMLRYRESKSFSEMKWMPYLSAKGEEIAYFYLDETGLWIEKNATYHCFSPQKNEDKEAYAAFYEAFCDALYGESESH